MTEYTIRATWEELESCLDPYKCDRFNRTFGVIANSEDEAIAKVKEAICINTISRVDFLDVSII